MALAVLCLVTSKFILAAPLFIFGLALLGRDPWYAWLKAQNPTASRFRTTLLDAEIDGATGAIRGRVVAGRFARRTIGSLNAHEATALWREARLKDPQGAQIIEAVLDSIDPRWRELQGANARDDASAKAQVSVKEAYNILGLPQGATKADIQRAHRDLMKRFHPDQGGSNYLAAKINEAKDLLMAQAPD